MIEVLIIADDMTGMLDTEVQFANRGIAADALLKEITVEDLYHSTASVVAVTVESRHVSREEAYRRTYKIAERAWQAGVKTILKKTDSVLRGHIGAELTAVMDATGLNKICFFPAYPDLGRTTKKGIQYIQGVPIDELGLVDDKLDPVKSSDVFKILSEETDAAVKIVQEKNVCDFASESKTIYVFDSERNEELYEQLRILRDQNETAIIAGCAGLAKEFAKMLPQSKAMWETKSHYNKLFAVCGSFNSVTKRQVRYAAEHGFEYFPIAINDLFGYDTEDVFDQETVLRKIRSTCVEGKSIVIAPVSEDKKFLDVKKDVDISLKIVDRLNHLLLACMDLLNDYAIFQTGGDTLSSFVKLSGSERIVLCGEIFPGVTINQFLFNGCGKHVISKSGGFGDEDVLVNCLEYQQRWEERAIV